MHNPLWIERILAGDATARAAELRADIEDEIADHLEQSAQRCRALSESPQGAEQLAREAFGDVSEIVGRCLWVHLGDRVMLRSLTLFAGVALCLLGSLLAYASLSAQRQMAAGLDNLAGQLAQLEQRVAKPPAPLRQPVVQGQLYLGDAAQPAARCELEIRRLPDGDTVRALRTDDNGRFSASHLPDGEYFLLTSLVGKKNAAMAFEKDDFRPRRMYQVQSAPFYVSLGSEDVAISLDVQHRRSALQLEFSEPVTETIGDPQQMLGNRIEMLLFPEELTDLPWTPNMLAPAVWPAHGVYGKMMAAGAHTFQRPDAYNVQSFDYAATVWGDTFSLAAGPYRFAVRLHVGGAGQASGGGGGFGGPDRRSKAMKRLDEARARAARHEPLFTYFGPLSLETARAGVEKYPRITLAPEMRTRVRLTVPPERQERLERVLLDENSTDEELAAAAEMIELKWEVVGQEPLGDEP